MRIVYDKKNQRIEKKENVMLDDNEQIRSLTNLYVYFAHCLGEIISVRQRCNHYGQGYLRHVANFPMVPQQSPSHRIAAIRGTVPNTEFFPAL
jgi:hypothetical protein